MGAAPLEGAAMIRYLQPIVVLVVMGLTSLATAVSADEPPPDTSGPTVIVVVGAPGTPDYAEQFRQWAGLWEQVCTDNPARFLIIGLKDGGEVTDRTSLQQAISGAANNGSASLWLVLIGHGTYDGRTAKFNLRGPDVSAEELADWLEPVQGRAAIINTTAASAPFLKSLSAPNRVVITATKSGFEQSVTHLGRFLSHAIGDREADLDRDGQTSLLEAFLAASHRVEEFYAGAGRLVTEHALLDDNGDTLGTPATWFRGIRPDRKAADGAPLDGYLAHQFHLCPSAAESGLSAQQRQERNRLELDVFKLRDARDLYPEEVYFEKLEALLTAIARLYQEAERTSASGAKD
jgi:hypothetical protein